MTRRVNYDWNTLSIKETSNVTNIDKKKIVKHSSLVDGLIELEPSQYWKGILQRMCQNMVTANLKVRHDNDNTCTIIYTYKTTHKSFVIRECSAICLEEIKTFMRNTKLFKEEHKGVIPTRTTNYKWTEFNKSTRLLLLRSYSLKISRKLSQNEDVSVRLFDILVSLVTIKKIKALDISVSRGQIQIIKGINLTTTKELHKVLSFV